MGQEKKVEKEIDRFYFNAAENYYLQEYDSAIVKFDILDFLYEDNSNIKYFLGMCYFFKSEFNTAITYYEESLIDVEYTNEYQNGKYAPHVVYFYLAYCYEKIGQFEAAINAYDDYINYEKNKEIIYNTKKRIEIIKLFHNLN